MLTVTVRTKNITLRYFGFDSVYTKPTNLTEISFLLSRVAVMKIKAPQIRFTTTNAPTLACVIENLFLFRMRFLIRGFILFRMRFSPPSRSNRSLFLKFRVQPLSTHHVSLTRATRPTLTNTTIPIPFGLNIRVFYSIFVPVRTMCLSTLCFSH